MDVIETNTAMRVEMLARVKITVGNLEPAPESAMFLLVVRSKDEGGCFAAAQRSAHALCTITPVVTSSVLADSDDLPKNCYSSAHFLPSQK